MVKSIATSNLAVLLKALSEEVRLKIINLLCQEELCISELTKRLSLSQSAVSHHIKILKQAGLICERRISKWRIYFLNDKGFNDLLSSLESHILHPVFNRCKKAIESQRG